MEKITANEYSHIEHEMVRYGMLSILSITQQFELIEKIHNQLSNLSGTSLNWVLMELVDSTTMEVKFVWRKQI